MSSTYSVGILAGGVQFYAPYVDHQWPVEMGFTAPMVEWAVPKDVAQGVLAALGSLTGSDRECTLTLGDSDDAGHFLTVERVICLGNLPGGDKYGPQQQRLVFTNVLWYVGRRTTCWDVNLRRRVGDKRLVGGSLVTEIPVDAVAYAPWSTNAGAAYDWDNFATHALDAATSASTFAELPGIAYAIDTFTVISATGQIVQETVHDGNGLLGLSRAIESIPGASVYVHPNGTIHVCESTPTSEAALVASLPPDLTGHGDIITVDRSGTRPDHDSGAWGVYFDLELELRADFDISAGPDPSFLDPYLLPVLQVTDEVLTVPAGTYYGGAVVRAEDTDVAAGSWITLDEALAAYNAGGFGASGNPYLLGPLTDDYIALNWYNPDALNKYAIGGGGLPDPLWVARVNEIKRTYRTFLRFATDFWDAVRHAWPQRAAIWDPVTGSRAPSPVYANFSVTPSQDAPAGTTNYFAMVNVSDSYPGSGDIVDGRPSGFTLDMYDEELGVFFVNRNVLAKFPFDNSVGVSDVIETPNPNNTPSVGPTTPVFAQLKLATTGDWKLLTVISIAPASSNDLRRLYEVDVSTAQAAEAAGLTGYSQPGYGPNVEFRSQMSEARVPWQDSEGGGVFDTLGLNSQTIGTTGIEDLTFNYTDGDLVSPAASGLVPINLTQEIIPVARAIAAADLLNRLDCAVGRKAVPGSATIVPIGTARRIVHKVQDNRWVTVVECHEPATGEFRPEDFLTGSARQFVLKQIASAR